MGLAKFSIYKYVRTLKGRCYCKPISGKNNKVKPDSVLTGLSERSLRRNLPLRSRLAAT